MAGMSKRRSASAARIARLARWPRIWLEGWAALLWRDDIDGYRQLRFYQRFALDCRALRRGLFTRGLWRAAFLFAVAATLMQIWIWRHDLRGPARDALYLVPTALIAPLAARGRRRQLNAILAVRITR